ncbi:hypothetical protein [Hymenobacter yonginensis]|uniref:DUF3857 domain-containing protein n=1 Tax=Hymenobacter yonginensis TaxID=748197 RepID=A0ABY7PNN3_9BACT|nr:hypothetical protein [Hymenobacter yonginensis]WBO84331.1 hypothetical protein O9Z63_18410 [Hymenobacter yonginensis]
MKALLSGFLLLLATASYAQNSSSAAPTDTTRAAETSSKSEYAPGEVVTPDGKLVKAYFPISVNGFEKTISYYYSHPEVRPFPKPHFISVDKIRSMTVRGQYSETLALNGKSLHLLAARLVDGPVELFNFAEAKSVPLPIPIPGAVLVPIVGIPYTKNHWYLRRGGELVEVKRGKFEEQISEYLSAQPELAAKVKGKADGYHYQDMVRIIGEYNQQAGASAR